MNSSENVLSSFTSRLISFSKIISASAIIRYYLTCLAIFTHKYEQQFSSQNYRNIKGLYMHLIE